MSNPQQSALVLATAIAFTTMAITAGIIYLTPLKNVVLVEPKINEVSPQDFFEKVQETPDEYLIIDVRSERDYNAGHVENAVNIPLHLLYDNWQRLPKSGKTIALICGGNRSSGVGYHYLEHHGFLNLIRITGGMRAWYEEGLPTATSDSTLGEILSEPQ